MQLGKLPQGNPAALIDGEVCLQVVNRSISRDDPTAHRVSIDNQFHRARAPQGNGLWWGPMKGDRITQEAFASGRRQEALSDGLGRCRRKGDTCLNTNGFCLGQRYLSKTGSDPSDPKIEGMSVTVGHIGATLLEPLAPLVKGKLINFPKLHINPALPDPAATHAGKVGFSAHLDREAAVEKVIPHVPLRNSGGIHGTDEIASPQRSRYTDFHSADAVHLGNHPIWQLIGLLIHGETQFSLAECLIAVFIDLLEGERQERLLSLFQCQELILVPVQCIHQTLRGPFWINL